jgi:hypothetical protein
MHRPVHVCEDAQGGAMPSESRSREPRGNAAIEDIAYGAPDGSTVEAFLITPARGAVGAASGPSSSDGAAGVVFWHWFDPKAPDGDARSSAVTWISATTPSSSSAPVDRSDGRIGSVEDVA